MVTVQRIFLKQTFHKFVMMNSKNRTTKRSKKLNIQLLTEVREEFETSKLSGIFMNSGIRKYNRENTLRLNSKKNMVSLKTLRNADRKQGYLLSVSSSKGCTRIDIIKQEILNSIRPSSYLKKNEKEQSDQWLQKSIEKLTCCFEYCEEIRQNLYSYKCMEKKLEMIGEKIKQFSSPTLQFYVYCHLAFIFYVYDSYSLTIFFFDKALKLHTNKKKYHFQRKLQTIAYQYAAKIFAQRQDYHWAKYLGYMFLRKAWFYGDCEEELNAYDLLGVIEMERGNVGLSKYFHLRMCRGILESKQKNQKIMIMSNNELQRKYHDKVEFFISENITVFAESEKEIIDIIQKHFKSEVFEQTGINETKQRLIYTHRSPNRNFKNYRTLERGMIEAKQSPEIHFVRQKNIRSIRKFLSEITSLFFEIRKQIIFEKKYNRVYIQNMGDEDEKILDP